MSSALRRFAVSSRNEIISLNFQPVSMCSSGKGMRPGKNALRARCSRTEESLPMEYMRMRLGELGRHFAEDVDAFGLQPGQMGQPGRPGVRRLPETGFRVVTGLNLGVHRDLSASVKSRPEGRHHEVRGTVLRPTPARKAFLVMQE